MGGRVHFLAIFQTVRYTCFTKLHRFFFLSQSRPMSQENLIKLVSLGDEKGVGKGHILYSHKNKKNKQKLELRKYNPIAKKHTVYKEKK